MPPRTPLNPSDPMICPSDKDLAQACQSGDSEAFAELVRRYGPWLKIRAVRVAPAHVAPEDLAHDVLLELMLVPSRFQGVVAGKLNLRSVLAMVLRWRGVDRSRELSMSPLPKESVETSEGSEPDECDATERGDKVVSDLWSKRLSVIRSSKQLSRLVKSTVLLSYYVRSLRALVVLLQGAPRGQIARRVRRHYRECSLTPEEWSMVLNGGRGQAVTLHDVVRLATAAGIRGRCLELVDATRAMGLCANSLLRRLQRGRNKLREEFPEEKALRDLEGEGW